MNFNRQNAISFGVLLIAAIVCGVFSSSPAIEESGYLEKLQSIESEVLIAVFFQAMMAIIYVAIVVITYPIVRRDNHSAAMAYLAFRIIGAAFLFVGIVTLLLFIPLGQQFSHVDADNLANLEFIGELLRQTRDGFNHIGMVLPWTIGGLFLYKAFFKIGLIPRWMSIWGLVSAVLTLVATMLLMLDQIQIVSIVYFALNMPTVLFEITLAVFLMVKGYRQSSPLLAPSQNQ